jgi:hypothetical protein
MKISDFRLRPIGEVIASGRLAVPRHQRDYYWEDEQVIQLFEDFDTARKNGQEYFLGTVVLTEAGDIFHVVDGQQRLATTMVMLAAIRDIYFKLGELAFAKSIENDYLSQFDRTKSATVSKLILNVRDQQFFLNNIILNPSTPERQVGQSPSGRSNERLEEAQICIRTKFGEIAESMPKPVLKEFLNDWTEFIQRKAKILSLTVADDENAYTVFETMNDRGLKVSEADLVKNHLYGLAEKSRLNEVVNKWQTISVHIESLGKKEDVVDFLRIYCTLFHGLTRRKDVFKTVRANVKTPATAVAFVYRLEEFSKDYTAMLTPSSSKWNDYPPSTRRSLQILSDLDVEQIRYLLLAVAHNFSKHETSKAFSLFINWIVRFFVASGTQVGRLESDYAKLSVRIQSGEIKTAQQLMENIQKRLPDDIAFEAAFSRVKVSSAKLARYYLQSLERREISDEDWEMVPDDDTLKVNLEHIIPLNFQEHWPELSQEMGQALYNRLGNMVLLNAKRNSRLGDVGFEEKKRVFENSAFKLTKAASKYSEWGEREVDERQSAMAKIAVKTWPLTIK